MPRKASCCCGLHGEWGHVVPSQDQLRIATQAEREFCCIDDDGKHLSRKRKICIFCRQRLLVEQSHKADDVLFDNIHLPLDSPRAVHEETLQVHDESNILLDETSLIQEEVHSESSNTGSKDVIDVSTQVEFLPPGKTYQSYGPRVQSYIRTDIINNISHMLNFYVDHNNDALHELMVDLLQSRKWKHAFGKPPAGDDVEKIDPFLKALVEEYQMCKEKENNQMIRENAKKLKQPIKIGGKKSASSISYEGTTEQSASSRTVASLNMGRVSTYGAERRRLLSIVAYDYSQTFLIKLFQCAKSTITAARVHYNLFGRGGVPPPSLKFTRQCVSQEVIDGLYDFLVRDGVSRPSSCRSVMVKGEECPVRYWQDSIKGIVKQYLMEFPNGVKRTYIYTHLPENFRSNSLLAGLCNLCEDFGYANFASLIDLVKELSTNAQQPALQNILSEIRDLQRYLKTKFAKEAQKHSSCAELCLTHALDSCNEVHDEDSQEFNYFYSITRKVFQAISIMPPDQTESLTNKLDDFKMNFWLYIGHILRTKHQADYYRYVLNNLKPGEAAVIVDYKMKLQLCMRSREIQRDWYGKRGISLHGFYVIAQVSQTERRIEVIDLWSDDTKQDAWFTESALDIGFRWMENNLPGFHIYLFSDNGPHYHNTSVLLYLTEVNKSFNLTLKEYNNFEAGEGKTVLDTHFAHVSHKLLRWVKVGNDLVSGEQLAHLLETMKNVKCKKLQIKREQAPKGIGTLKDISLYGSFKFPTSGSDASGLVLQSVAGVGSILKKSKQQLTAISGRTSPIAGNTGAAVTEEEWIASDDVVVGTHQAEETYSVKFIQESAPALSKPNLAPCKQDYQTDKPDAGFAIKRGGGKRTTFSQEQKDIMILFYNRQKASQIRANPSDVIDAMKEAGLSPLKESQIKSWWSTYHRKQKQIDEDLRLEAQELRRCQQGEVSRVVNTECTQVVVQPNSTPTSVQGLPSVAYPNVTEWFLVESQSNINGRSGSNACVFIALSVGKLVMEANFDWPQENTISSLTVGKFKEAMIKGNGIHEDLFDFQPVNVDVDTALVMADEECSVDKVLYQNDIFGQNPQQQLNDLFENEALKQERGCHVIVADGRALLFVVNQDGSAMIFDSHQHGSEGAVIAFTKTGHVSSLATWFSAMMRRDWQYMLTIASMHKIAYR